MMKKGYIQAEAIVLGAIDFGESDRIISLYTLEEGKVAAIAKGARRSKRRFVGKLDAPTCLTVTYHRGKGELVRLDEAVLLNGYNGLKGGIDTYGHGCYLIELTSEMTREGQVNAPFYFILTAFLDMMDRAGGTLRDAGPDTPAILTRFFEIKTLMALGYMPALQGCMKCEKLFDADAGGGDSKVYFSSARGGIFCARCAGPDSRVHLDQGGTDQVGIDSGGGLMAVSGSTVAFLRSAARMKMDKLKRLKPGELFRKEGGRLLDDFIRFHVGREFKTRSFIAKLAAQSAQFNGKTYVNRPRMATQKGPRDHTNPANPANPADPVRPVRA